MKKSIVFMSVLCLFWVVQPAKISAQEFECGNFEETEQCYTCHGDPEFTAEQDGVSISLYVDKAAYDSSVHGTVDCISCHKFDGPPKYGEELQAAVSETCTNCHTGAGFDYGRSIHKEANGGPNCADCHGAHEILPVSHNSSLVSSKNLSQTCGECHQQVSQQYEESFHGKAVALGAIYAPDCTTCHNSHQILSKDNPVALVNPERKTTLCSECHEGSTLGTQSVEHYRLEAKGFGAPMYWVKKVFMWLILLVVGFFLIHIELDLWHKLRLRKS